MPTRRIEVNEPVTIKPVMKEVKGEFKPVPGQFAYYTAGGAPLRQGGETITVQAGDTLVLPAGHRIETLDLRYKNAAGEPLVGDQLRNVPAVSVENRGRALGIQANSGKVTLAGGNFTMQMPLATLSGVTGTPAGNVINVTTTGTIADRAAGGFTLNTGAGSIAVAENTRLEVTTGVRGAPILTIDGDEKIAQARARHADMLKTAKETAARGNLRAKLAPTPGLNPEYTVANTPAAPANRTFPDVQPDVKPDTAGRPAGQQPAPGTGTPGTGTPGTGTPGTGTPSVGRPAPPTDRRGPGVVPPVVTPPTGGTPATKPATPGGEPATRPVADPRRDAAAGLAKDIQTIITARGTDAGESPDGRLGFFNARKQGNVVVADAYDAIVEAQKAADALGKGQANTPEARKNFSDAMDRAVNAMDKFEDNAKKPDIRKEAKSIKERLEKIRERAKTGKLLSMNIDGAISPDALAMLTSVQPSAAARSTPETAMSAEAIALLTGDNGTRGSVEDLPPALRTPGTTRQV
jgi:hypothetical protein